MALQNHWKRTGPLLDEIRRREVAAMTPAERMQAMHDVLELADTSMPPRMTSGLVEMYRRLNSCPALRTRRMP